MVNEQQIEQRFGPILFQSVDEYKVCCPKCKKKALWVNPVRNIYYPIGYKSVYNRNDFSLGWDYIESRNINPKTVVFGKVKNDENYVYFPVIENGNIVYWQARTIHPMLKRKTKNPSNFEIGGGKSGFVYNIDKIIQGEPIFVTEGVFDAYTMNGVATLGKLCSVSQARKILSRLPSIVYICYDSDTWTVNENYCVTAARIFSELRDDVPVIPVKLSNGDPNDLGREAVLKTALLQFKSRQFSAHLRLSSVSCALYEKQLQEILQDA